MSGSGATSLIATARLDSHQSCDRPESEPPVKRVDVHDFVRNPEDVIRRDTRHEASPLRGARLPVCCRLHAARGRRVEGHDEVHLTDLPAPVDGERYIRKWCARRVGGGTGPGCHQGASGSGGAMRSPRTS